MTRTPLPERYAEGLGYFMGEGELNNVLERLCAGLSRNGIDYFFMSAVQFRTAVMAGRSPDCAARGSRNRCASEVITMRFSTLVPENWKS